MKRSLMTAKELQERYLDDNALELSIEKWQRAGYKSNWETLKDSPMHYIDGRTCGLCSKYFDTDYGECYNCPLKSCGEGTYWDKVYGAALRGDRDKFMKARNALLKKMKKARDAK